MPNNYLTAADIPYLMLAITEAEERGDESFVFTTQSGYTGEILVQFARYVVEAFEIAYAV